MASMAIIMIVTFSKAHLSWVYSAYLLIKGSSLSGIIVLQLEINYTFIMLINIL